MGMRSPVRLDTITKRGINNVTCLLINKRKVPLFVHWADYFLSLFCSVFIRKRISAKVREKSRTNETVDRSICFA